MKKVWYENELWNVKEILHPTKFDCYLLCEKEDAKSIHEDEKTHPILMILIDTGNDTFVFDSPRARRYIKSIIGHKSNEDSFQRKIENIWLEDVKHLK